MRRPLSLGILLVIRSMWRLSGLCLLTVLLVACTDDPAVATDAGAVATDAAAGHADAGTPPPPPVVVGNGVTGFAALAPGDTVELILGPQGGGRMGGYHVWTGVQVRGFDPVGLEITMTILDAQTHAEHARLVRRLRLQPAGDTHVAYGLNAVLTDCCAASGERLIIRAAVLDSTGKAGNAEVEVLGADSCPDANGVDVCP